MEVDLQLKYHRYNNSCCQLNSFIIPNDFLKLFKKKKIYFPTLRNRSHSDQGYRTRSHQTDQYTEYSH